MYTCCGRSFEAQGLRQHLDNSFAHSNEIECRWCFARWPTHSGKLRLKHEQEKHWYRCKDCTWMFQSENGLQEHIDKEHPPNFCYGCQRSFQSLNHLNQVCLTLQRLTPYLISLLPAPQVIRTCRKERQMSLVHHQIHQSDRRLSASGVRKVYIWHQPRKDQPILPGGRPRSHLYEQTNRMAR